MTRTGRSDARAVTIAMERMARGGWSLGHPIAGGRRRWWPVPSLAVVELLRGDMVTWRHGVVNRRRQLAGGPNLREPAAADDRGRDLGRLPLAMVVFEALVAWNLLHLAGRPSAA